MVVCVPVKMRQKHRVKWKPVGLISLEQNLKEGILSGMEVDSKWEGKLIMLFKGRLYYTNLLSNIYNYFFIKDKGLMYLDFSKTSNVLLYGVLLGKIKQNRI